MKTLLKRLASKLPIRWQQGLKRIYFARQIKKGRFVISDKEFKQLGQWLTEGDWALDIGANIGHYTARMSEIAGKEGRIIAVEPVPETFEILAANMTLLRAKNVTLLNIAASDSFILQGITIPTFDHGSKNYYMAHLTNNNPDFSVLCLPIDTLHLPHTIRLVKIDAEGHDYQVLKGMKNLLKRDCPTLIVESCSAEVISFLNEIGYSHEKNEGSPNLVFQHPQLPKKPNLLKNEFDSEPTYPKKI